MKKQVLIMLFVIATIFISSPLENAAAWGREKKQEQPPCLLPATPAFLPPSSLDTTPHIFPQAGQDIYDMKMSNDGKLIASNDVNSIKIWDVASGREIRTILAHPNNTIRDISLSSDGSRIFSFAGDGIKTWDVRSGEQMGQMEFPNELDAEGFPAQVFCSDGSYAFFDYEGGQCGIFATQSGKKIHDFKGRAQAISPQGRYVLIDQSPKIVLWDVCLGKKVASFKEKKMGYADGAIFSPDGKLLALRTDHYEEEKDQIFLLETRSGKVLWKTPKVGFISYQIRFSADSGQLFLFMGMGETQEVSFERNALAILDAKTGTPIQAPELENGYCKGLRPTPDGKSLLMENNRGIAFLEKDTYQVQREIKAYRPFSQVAAMPDGKLLTFRHIWDLETGQPSSPNGLNLDEDFGKLGIVTTDGKFLITTKIWEDRNTASVTKWDIEYEVPVKAIDIPLLYQSRLSHINVSPNGKYVLVDEHFGYRVIDLDANRKILEMKPGQGYSPNLTSEEKLEILSWEFFAFSKDSKTLAGIWTKNDFDADVKQTSGIIVWDIASGAKRMRMLLPDVNVDSPSFRALDFTDNESHLLASANGYVKKPEFNTAVILYFVDIRSGNLLWKLVDSSAIDTISGQAVSQDGKWALTGHNNGKICLWSLTSGQKNKVFNGLHGGGWPVYLGFNKNMTQAWSHGAEGLRIWNISTGRELARAIDFMDGEWLSITPEGFYASSPNADQYLNVRVGNKVQSLGQYYNQFYRPDMVAAKVRGDSDTEAKTALASTSITKATTGGSPPQIAFVSPENNASMSTRDVELVVDVVDTGGGIGRMEWKINGVTVGVSEEKDRGIYVQSKPGQEKTSRLKKLVTLSPGANVIQVVANNLHNQITSNPDSLTINLKDDISTPPSLYLVAVGINKYRDKAMWLNYSVPDGKAIAQALKQSSQSIFDNVHITEVYDENATARGIGVAFEALSGQVQTQDVFVLYLAGHGVTQDGKYHFLPQDFRFRNEDSIAQNAITQDDLQRWLAMIQARKSLVLMDTCNSGSFTQAKAAQRGIAEKTAINKLTRATGRATIVAAKDDQPALEGYKGHGVFTYALIQAFGAADQDFGNRDKQISIFELSAYIDEHVPKITYERFGYEQIPQVRMQGRDFPIGMVK